MWKLGGVTAISESVQLECPTTTCQDSKMELMEHCWVTIYRFIVYFIINYGEIYVKPFISIQTVLSLCVPH